MKKSNRVFGIDLGTTYSAIAYVAENGRSEIVPNAQNERTTPSVVWFDEGKIVVGDAAKEEARFESANVCSFVKRNMGDDDFRMKFGFNEYSPEEISSFILRKIVKDAQKRLGEEIRDVVITCPAYFFVKERDATRRAGELAGLNVLQIVDEPTAAAISYGFTCGDDEKTVLAFDLGGGTFDVAAIRVSPEKIEVVCADGDHRLGGKDWDDRLVEMIAERFQNETGCAENPLDFPETFSDFLGCAEKLKKGLTVRESFSERFSFQGETARIEITRQEFEDATRDLLERTVEFAKNVEKTLKAKTGGRGFDDLILVGGSSKMPAVARRLREAFGKEPILFEPDEAVARGAAIIGANLKLREAVEAKLRERRSTDLTLEEAFKEVAEDSGYAIETIKRARRQESQSVASGSFGVDTLWVDFRGEEIRTTNLIYRGDSIPNNVTNTFGTVVPYQKSVLVTLRQNTATREEAKNGVPCDAGKILWEDELPLPFGLPMGAEINVTFRMTADQKLCAKVQEPTSQNYVETEIDACSVRSDDEKRRQARRCGELIVE